MSDHMVPTKFGEGHLSVPKLFLNSSRARDSFRTCTHRTHVSHMLALALQCSSTSRGRLGRTQSDAVAAAQPVAAVEWEGAGARRGRNLLTESDAAGRQTGRPEGPSGCCRAQKLAPLIANASQKLRRVVLWRWPADCSADPASPAALLRRLEADPVALGGYLADVYGSVAHAAGHTPPLGTLSFFWNSVPHRAEVVAPIAHHNVRSCFMAHGQVPLLRHLETHFQDPWRPLRDHLRHLRHTSETR